jgi:hypothetical protein
LPSVIGVDAGVEDLVAMSGVMPSPRPRSRR